MRTDWQDDKLPFLFPVAHRGLNYVIEEPRDINIYQTHDMAFAISSE